MLGTALVRATILLATILWAWAEVLKIRRPGEIEPARRVWTTGLGLALIHALMAFDVAYAWSHANAWADTARQTAAMTGLEWGGGIIVNYLFLALWLGDVVWWWIAPVAYTNRPLPLERARLFIFVFMFFNGAIVFAGSAGRAVGVPAVAAVCVAWALDARRRPVHA
jgi:hypothetical protein